MALVHMHDMLLHAYENKYAIGAFDVVNLDMLQGVIEAAERCRAPVIIGLAEPHLSHFNLMLIAPAVEAAARSSSVPVAIHYDHAGSLEGAIEGIRSGCNSLMIDGANMELQENIDLTKETVKVAHACGIPVEAELGYVPENGDELVMTSAAEASGFVRYTEVDFLAVSIGTVHGRSRTKPRLDYTRLRQINEAVGIPLVLHGSSGLSEDQFHRLISNGIAKINYFTALTDRAGDLLRKNVKNGDDGYLALFNGVRQAVEEEADRLMRIWGSAGRAAEVMERCRPWKLVDHIIKFNLPDSDASEAALIVERGRWILAEIPGVRDVILTETLDDPAEHRYRWILRVTSPQVVEQLRRHSAFNTFMNRYVHNQATGLVSKTFLQNVPEIKVKPF